MIVSIMPRLSVCNNELEYVPYLLLPHPWSPHDLVHYHNPEELMDLDDIGVENLCQVLISHVIPAVGKELVLEKFAESALYWNVDVLKRLEREYPDVFSDPEKIRIQCINIRTWHDPRTYLWVMDHMPTKNREPYHISISGHLSRNYEKLAAWKKHPAWFDPLIERGWIFQDVLEPKHLVIRHHWVWRLSLPSFQKIVSRSPNIQLLNMNLIHEHPVLSEQYSLWAKSPVPTCAFWTALELGRKDICDWILEICPTGEDFYRRLGEILRYQPQVFAKSLMWIGNVLAKGVDEAEFSRLTGYRIDADGAVDILSILKDQSEWYQFWRKHSCNNDRERISVIFQTNRWDILHACLMSGKQIEPLYLLHNVLSHYSTKLSQERLPNLVHVLTWFVNNSIGINNKKGVDIVSLLCSLESTDHLRKFCQDNWRFVHDVLSGKINCLYTPKANTEALEYLAYAFRIPHPHDRASKVASKLRSCIQGEILDWHLASHLWREGLLFKKTREMFSLMRDHCAFLDVLDEALRKEYLDKLCAMGLVAEANYYKQ